MKKKEISIEQTLELIKDYTDNFLSTHLLSGKYKLTQRRVLGILRSNDIEIRSSGQQFNGGKSAADKRYHDKNKEKLTAYHSDWQKENREHLNRYHKQWRENNIGHHRETKRKYEKNRKASDPIYKLISNFRTAIYTVLKENNVDKYGHYFDVLGYSQQDLMNHLEKKFKDGITWDNYGKWHIDHIKPISSFIIKDMYDDEFKKCWALENLQPMWGSENIKKYNHIV